VLDVFSRYMVGWSVQERESGEIAKDLIGQAVAQQQVARDTLTVHADRGSSMTSKPVAYLLADLGVTKTHNRPCTSSDNPYSEAHFKTLKYRPAFPARFASIEEALAFCREFFAWQGHEHRHSGIGLMAPAAVHYGRTKEIHDQRARVLAAAYARTPERFVARPPRPPELPKAAWINKPDSEPDSEEVAHLIPATTVSFGLTGSAAATITVRLGAKRVSELHTRLLSGAKGGLPWCSDVLDCAPWGACAHGANHSPRGRVTVPRVRCESRRGHHHLTKRNHG
jgi:hypothetical protein